MVAYAERARERSSAVARSRAAPPETARQREQRLIGRASSLIDGHSSAREYAAAAVEQAREAARDADVDRFHSARDRARRAIARARKARGEIAGLELGGEQRARLEEIAAPTADELDGELTSIREPMPWDRRLAIEEALLAAMPGSAPRDAQRAFDGAEARLRPLFAAMSPGDRVLFHRRLVAAERDGAREDELMRRWLRLGRARRNAIVSGRGPRPMAVATGAIELEKRLEANLTSATGDAETLTAREYLALWESRLLEDVGALLCQGSYGVRDPALELELGFAGVLADELRSGGLAALQHAAAEPLESIVDRNRAVRSMSASDFRDAADAESMDRNDGGEAIRRRNAEQVSGAAHRATGSLAVGPVDWSPRLALELASMIDRQVFASLDRLAPRAVAAGLEARKIIPGHPFDRHVIRALCRDGAARIVDEKVGERAPVTTAVRPIELEWSDEPRLWNWLEVTAPADATAEDVAAHILGDPARAHELTAAPPLFGVPAAAMARVAPKRQELAGQAIAEGAVAGDLDAATLALRPNSQLELAASTEAGETGPRRRHPWRPGRGAGPGQHGRGGARHLCRTTRATRPRRRATRRGSRPPRPAR